ncbi:hypothetical protein QTP88_002490 [Uroleucon formosanum]
MCLCEQRRVESRRYSVGSCFPKKKKKSEGTYAVNRIISLRWVCTEREKGEREKIRKRPNTKKQMCGGPTRFRTLRHPHCAFYSSPGRRIIVVDASSESLRISRTQHISPER